MKYKAIFLDDKEFEQLPYRDMGEKIGVADPRTGTAYARKSGIPVIDAFTIMHELEHLEEGHGGEHADHFDPELGVYYKGFGNLFSALGGAANSVGGGLSNIGGAVSRGAGAISRGAGSITRGVGNFLGGGQAPMGGAVGGSVGQGGITMSGANPMGGVKGGYFDQPFAQSGGGMTNPMTAFSPGGSVQPTGSIHPGVRFPTTGAFTPKSATTPGQSMDAFNKFFPRGGSLPPVNFNFGGSGGGGQQPPMQPPPQPQQPPAQAASGGGSSQNPLKTIFGENANLGQIGAGTALAGFGQLASPKVNVPNIAELPSVQALKGMNFRNFRELDPALEAATNRDFDMIDARERDRLVSTYKSLRPGADIESDSSFRRDMDELQRMQGMRRADSLAKYRFEFLSKQLQMSELEMRQMTELAYMDIATIMLQLGVDAQTAQDFKSAFTGVGTALVSSGLGINQQEPANASQPA